MTFKSNYMHCYDLLNVQPDNNLESLGCWVPANKCSKIFHSAMLNGHLAMFAF